MRVSDARTEWNGLVVHKDEWESRHPQDMIRVRKERTAPSGPVRPDSTADGTGVCTAITSSSISYAAVASCAVAGRDYDGSLEFICSLENRSAVAGNASAGCFSPGTPYSQY
jgi:hypothetical protein